MVNNIYQTLGKLMGKQPTERIQAKYIYLDERTKQIKAVSLNSAGASVVNINAAKLMHDFIFH